MRILYWNVKELTKKKIPMVKVLWKNHGIEKATWELEPEIKNKHPNIPGINI